MTHVIPSKRTGRGQAAGPHSFGTPAPSPIPKTFPTQAAEQTGQDFSPQENPPPSERTAPAAARARTAAKARPVSPTFPRNRARAAVTWRGAPPPPARPAPAHGQNVWGCGQKGTSTHRPPRRPAKGSPRGAPVPSRAGGSAAGLPATPGEINQHTKCHVSASLRPHLPGRNGRPPPPRVSPRPVASRAPPPLPRPREGSRLAAGARAARKQN